MCAFVRLHVHECEPIIVMVLQRLFIALLSVRRVFLSFCLFSMTLAALCAVLYVCNLKCVTSLLGQQQASFNVFMSSCVQCSVMICAPCLPAGALFPLLHLPRSVFVRLVWMIKC